MSRSVRIVLLCEDSQHETFARRFLLRDGWNLRDLRIVRSPSGRGSAEQFVREHFPQELQAVRAKGGESVHLIVMIDGDDQGVAGRRASLDAACAERKMLPPGDADHVLICVPTRSIETWLAFLQGEKVDETRRGYPRLTRPRDCEPCVQTLVDMCRDQTPPVALPPSLEDTCTQYRLLR